jgi:hypothetical protein
VLAAYYVLAYLGFAAPYGVDGLNAGLGRPGTFAVLAAAAAAVTGLMLVRAARVRPAPPSRGDRTGAARSRTAPDPPPAGPAWQGRDYRDAETSQGERT